MPHPALDIDLWHKVEPTGSEIKLPDKRVMFSGVNIDVAKFYFYLFERFGYPNVEFDSVKKFFPEMQLETGLEWCYLFKAEGDFILISGENCININVFSSDTLPEEIDFHIFTNKLSTLIKNFQHEDYRKYQYFLYLNYSYLLKKLIHKKKSILFEKMPYKPETLRLDVNNVNTTENDYMVYEYSRDYNKWTEKVIEKSLDSIEIQILLPIYQESLIDIAFRVKLKQSLFNRRKEFELGRRKVDVFEYFKRLNINKKLNFIEKNCVQINKEKLARFKEELGSYRTRQRRNELLHGNSLSLANLGITFYFDNNFIIGLADGHEAVRNIPESFESALMNTDVFEMITTYEELNDQFLNCFEDNGYLKTLADGIIFGHNPYKGGTLDYPIRIDQLFLPE